MMYKYFFAYFLTEMKILYNFKANGPEGKSKSYFL